MGILESLHIGGRKAKSILAILLAFFVWQIPRAFLSGLSVHPLFAYMCAVLEMRESIEKTRSFGFRRVKSTGIGLVFGLVGIFIHTLIIPKIEIFWLSTAVELIIILSFVLLALSAAQLMKCDNFSSLAAICVIICLVGLREDTNLYIYALTRVSQTALGVFSALVVNRFIYPPKNKEDSKSG
ncbi:MAG TPA: hypothetical protein GXX54_00105 [Clostridiales bacterium]|nr:hypothetical protein [Clostridiales bacterium]